MTPLARTLAGHWFTLALAALFGLAWLIPEAGPLLNRRHVLGSAAITLVFFNTGLLMRAAEALHAAAAWRVHAFVQLFSFVLIPALCWLALLPARPYLPEGLVIGFYLLAVLPTTVTSCVIFTQLAHGHVAAALFNSVFGNLVGIFISPTLFLLMIGGGNTDEIQLDTRAIVVKLALLVFLPFIVGKIGGSVLGARRHGWRKRLSVVNSLCILLTVFFAFCGLFLEQSLGATPLTVALPLALIVPAHGLLLGLAWWGAGLLRFSRADCVAILFCAPQKTLALGLPLIAACLASRPDLHALATLPIIAYHPLQLTAAAALAPRLGRHRPVQHPPDCP